ncbi:SpaH/EbpB family LPXTG-anchored major pilin [Facklamia sp. 7083-14-GEN3]|uniref:SpaH/EbpB family LPXTG-anchored major pilin n=1 Tax=Facklamia sp. 7083-14-GEN3 TaxID=2973478 RepID=UPI00215C0435|nr:SpaH/EbpB family LPXTG-anchored major pilin [Facklamia sp. 7083-14-GEN3]MCR8968884.1 SpaH/EbpB family LPXTG-anchored major pilin [Facklamia sp. 7083-14-GEN3]
MKNNKFLRTFLVLILGLSTFISSSLSVSAEEKTVNVIIHKLQADKFNTTGDLNQDGKPLNQADIEKLGTNVTTLDNVVFTAYKITEKQYNDAISDVANMPEQPKEVTKDDVVLEATKDGSTTWTKTYNPAKSEYYVVYETSKPDSVTGYVAVPFLIAFPMTAADGSGYLNEVNIYPKNITGAFPVVGKDIVKLGQKTASYNVGESFTYILKGTIPTNIEKYTEYTFVDELDPSLTIDPSDLTNITVTVGGETINNFETNYDPENNNNNTLKISLGTIGIAEIAEKVPFDSRNKVEDVSKATTNDNATPFIEVHFNAYINSKADANTNIINKSLITYNNGSMIDNANTASSDNVTVKFGNKSFKKINGENIGLDGAKFALKENDDPVKWNKELIALNEPSNSNIFVSSNEEGTFEDGDEIVLKSSSDGTFVINGLAYSNQATEGSSLSQYTLTEVKAPEGYQLLGEPVNFEVNDQGEVESILNNKRPSIPATGGIGTIIFIVAGISLMFFAIIGRRKAKEEA